MTVNENLANINTTHQHQVERFKRGVSVALLALFKQLERELKNSLLSYDMSKWSRTKQTELLKQLEKIRKSGVGNINKKLLEDMKGLNGAEVQFYTKQINTVLEDAEVKAPEAKTPPLASTWKKTRDGKIVFDDGATFSVTAFVNTFDDRNQLYLKQALEKGWKEKLSMVALSSLLFGVGGYFKRSEAQLEGLSHTALQYSSAEARNIAYLANSRMIHGYEWISVMDSKTTEICRHNSGLVYYYGRPDLSTLDGNYLPPVHMRCRSITAPIVKSAEELGIDPVAGLNGVPAGTATYSVWFAQQPNSIKKDVLGPTRYEMWRAGDIDIDAFYAFDGRQLTLAQLIEKGEVIPEQFLRYVN